MSLFLFRFSSAPAWGHMSDLHCAQHVQPVTHRCFSDSGVLKVQDLPEYSTICSIDSFIELFSIVQVVQFWETAAESTFHLPAVTKSKNKKHL